MEKHLAHDSGDAKAKKDKINLKKKAVKSPNLSNMYSVHVYKENAMGKIKSHIAYNTTLEGLKANMKAGYIYGEIKEPKK